MMSIWTKFLSTLRAFRAAQAGNVAITFVFATLPIIAFVGAAVDYSRANSIKTAMQAALNSTALMLSKEAATDTTAQLQTNASNYFKALFTRNDAINVQVAAIYSQSSATSMVVNATAEVPTALLGVIGIHKIDLNLSSTSKWGETRLRVALVLDNTGSMADSNKMTALKAATTSLLAQLKTAVTTNGDVYVSIVPFVKDVNIGAGNYSSDYIYWGTLKDPITGGPGQDPTASDNTSWDANYGQCKDTSGNNSTYKPRSTCLSHGTCSLSGYTSPSSCTGAGTCSISGHTSQSTCTSNGVCSKSQYTKQTKCQNNGGTWTAGVWTLSGATWTAYTWTPNNHNTWNGCVMDRGYPMSPSTLSGLSGQTHV